MANNNEKVLSTLADMNEAIGNRFDEIGQEIAEFRGDMEQRLTHILQRLNRIEDLILQEHARRLEALERKVGLSQ